uniref:P/Homo B domain-containing protein n=1 Tax=Anabas testudineus TaxID=64144 RepID=A0A7N6A6U0_ANATE
MTSFARLLLLTAATCQSMTTGRGDFYTNHWAVRVTGGPEQAEKIAAKYGYLNLGQIGGLEDHYHFHHSRVVRRAAYSLKGPHSFIHMDPMVDWAQQQVVKQRVRRYAPSDPNFIHFNDPKWSNMWYIHCNDKSSSCRSEMNILSAWQRGYTGKNVVVTILDDGIERNHPDLVQNYDHLASYDVNGNDHDPTPRYDSRNENIHGTRCAGEVAAVANNSHCIVGIAYNAQIGGIRMLDGDVTDIVEAKSLGIRPDYIHVYSASWGPKDDGKTVDGPGPLTKKAFEQGIKKGRKGLGSIFVWASGNGGRQGDHCSCDGYTSSIYTISISSTTENGNKPWYLEVCSSIIATTYSSGEFNERKIMTTDLRQRCTDGHTGTSVSAPIVAGIIALALEANMLLTWRDVQHLLVQTSRPVHLKADDWKTNAAGHRVSHLYGFGLVDAEAMVLEATKWRTVPPQHTCIQTPERLNSSITTFGCSEEPLQHVDYLEHVVVKVLISHPRRGDLEINLVSPSGTRSQLLAKRLFDSSNEGFRNWDWCLYLEQLIKSGIILIIIIVTLYRKPKRMDTDPLWHISEPLPTPQCSTLPLKTGRTCVSHCPLGHYEDIVSHRCRRCYKGCERCVGRSAGDCLSCRRGFYLNTLNSSCVDACPSGYFANEGRSTCMQLRPNTDEILLKALSIILIRYTFCHSVSYVCSPGPGKEECIQCAEGYLQQEWRCVQTCAPGYYPGEFVLHNSSLFCCFLSLCVSRCEENCLSCRGSGPTCTKCKEGYSLISRTCVVNASCNNGEFEMMALRNLKVCLNVVYCCALLCTGTLCFALLCHSFHILFVYKFSSKSQGSVCPLCAHVCDGFVLFPIRPPCYCQLLSVNFIMNTVVWDSLFTKT